MTLQNFSLSGTVSQPCCYITVQLILDRDRLFEPLPIPHQAHKVIGRIYGI
ncbi:MAG: hypothetical protein MUF49_24215 [Oculatellaceae cyanobacterium Prado106]|nr:hypothetical protein [Oculatellaceae cyanobacterium Prado106]